jgi:hypothetical protein
MTPRRVAEEIAHCVLFQIGPDEQAVADAIEKALHDQIEACAKVADVYVIGEGASCTMAAGAIVTQKDIATIIRAMKGSKP